MSPVTINTIIGIHITFYVDGGVNKAQYKECVGVVACSHAGQHIYQTKEAGYYK